MKTVLNMLLLPTAASVIGCNPHREIPAAEDHKAQPVRQEPNQFENPGRTHAHESHDHHRTFANPAELAKKWNDPGRDKWQYPEEIVDSLELKPGATVADIGAGTGYMVAHLSKAVGKDGTVVAIDTSAAMIEYLEAHGNDLGPAIVKPKLVNPDDPSLTAESLDGVLTLDTWHHMRRHEDYARKVYDGLKHGGKFVVVDHEVDAEIGPPKEMRLASPQVKKQLETAGFRVEILRESMPRHYLIVGHKD